MLLLCPFFYSRSFTNNKTQKLRAQLSLTMRQFIRFPPPKNSNTQNIVQHFIFFNNLIYSSIHNKQCLTSNENRNFLCSLFIFNFDRTHLPHHPPQEHSTKSKMMIFLISLSSIRTRYGAHPNLAKPSDTYRGHGTSQMLLHPSFFLTWHLNDTFLDPRSTDTYCGRLLTLCFRP